MTNEVKQTDIRYFRVSSDRNYAYTNVGLISYLTVKRQNSIRSIHLIINGIGIPPTKMSDTEYEWNIYQIRQDFRNTIPMTQDENEKRRLETTFVFCGLQAIQYYSGLQSSDLESTIFTNDLTIYFSVDSKSTVKHLDISEVYYISNAHKKN